MSQVQSDYRQCSLSVMDNLADPHITFDEKGICNYYYEYLAKEKEHVLTGEAGAKKLAEIVARVKAEGANQKYDCITGVSGGVDSTYLTYQAVKLGLRPLVVHFDNGWNSEMAVKNIENIISGLGLDLFTYVINWEEFRDLQVAYFKASVVDIEAITDHAIIGTLYRLAAENNIRYILSGTNIVTEATLPKHWIFSKTDHNNILDIHRQFGSVPLKTYPIFDSKLKRYYHSVKKIETLSLLNYMPYVKKDVKKLIQEELGWRDYGGKHYESVFTRFYQGYILPEKFGIDKRKAHLSNLIFSGQMTKAEALAELSQPGYDAGQLKTDKEFVLKKLGFSEEEFAAIMRAPRREHTEFQTEMAFFDQYPYLRLFRPIVRASKRILAG